MKPGIHKASGTDKVLIVERFGENERARLARYRDCTQLALHDSEHADLAFVRDLPRCRSLELYRTKVADYSALARVRSLRTLFLSGIADHEDLAFLGTLTQLTSLSLLYLPQLVRFPNLRRSTKLTYVMLWQCKRLADITELTKLPALEEVRIVDTPQAPNDLVPLLRKPKLRYASAQFGSKRANEQFAALLAKHGKAAHR